MQKVEVIGERMEEEIGRINNYEKRWKIQTNLNKFKLIHLELIEHLDVRLEGRTVPSSTGGNMLGLAVIRIGYKEHVKQLESNTKKELVKTWRIN